jgi:uncharacterized RDD family membrane protein YckC
MTTNDQEPPATPPESMPPAMAPDTMPPPAPPEMPAVPPPMASPPPVNWAPAAPPPPGPAPGLKWAGFWSRTVAYIIDIIIVGVIAGALSIFSGPVFVNGPNGLQFDYARQGPTTLVSLIYFIGFWVWRAQTPGMIVFGMRVVRADNGQPIDLGRAILRYIGLIISFLVIFLGVIWVAFDSRKQGWHDKLAGTVVVRPV